MKRISVIIALMALCLLSVSAPDARKAYIEKYSSIAVEEMKRTGVPASITLAQGILESDAGRSRLATKANNHFGIKCHNDWKGRTIKEDDNQRGECFRVYPSEASSFKDHSDFLRSRDRYKSLFELEQTDYKGWAEGLKKAGYATDPAYASKLIKLIEDYELWRYDDDAPVSLPSPSRLEESKPLAVAALREGFNESYTFSVQRQVYEKNGVLFIYALEGDSYESIAKENSLFLSQILKYNDLSESKELTSGEVVYLSRKKAQAAPGLNKHIVDSDSETLWQLSQRYAIRLDALRKMNILLLGSGLQEGDTVILRKK